jgi:hypothetical protein
MSSWTEYSSEQQTGSRVSRSRPVMIPWVLSEA